MTLIGQRRMQQGVFEALASQNRFQGSGSGSGLLPIPQSTFNNTLGQGVSGNSFTTVTGSPITIPSGRATFFLLSGYLALNWSNGTQTAIFSPFVDGTQVQNIGMGPFPNTSMVVPCPISYVTPNALAPGNHTFDIRVNAGAATGYNLQQFAFYVFALN